MSTKFEDREHRHYRSRFPLGGIVDRSGRRDVARPRVQGSPEAGDGLVFLAGYGRNSESLAEGLTEAGNPVLVFRSFQTALDEIPRLRPEVVLAGHTEHGGDVFHFLSRVGRDEDGPLLVFLAEHTDSALVSRALEHGAHDVVAPPHSVASIQIRLHVGGQARVEGTQSTRAAARRLSLGDLTLDLPTRRVLSDQPVSLSGREFQLLVRLMEAGGEVVCREDLMADIWGASQDSEGVLDATVHRLRRKLEDRFCSPDLVRTIRGIGYRLDPDEAVVQQTAAD